MSLCLGEGSVSALDGTGDQSLPCTSPDTCDGQVKPAPTPSSVTDPAKASVPMGDLLRYTRLLQWVQILNSPPKYAFRPLGLEELICLLRQSCRR